jgi:thiol-disulfide isomerase/thioredoxin
MTIASLLIALITAIPSSAATSEPVLLDFHAEWCGPCRQMRPAVAQLSRKGYPIKSIDIDQAPDLKEKYGVDAVPTFIVVDPHGRELGRTSGSQPAARLARFYLDAKAKAQPPANSRAHAGGDAGDDADGAADEADSDRDAATTARSRADQNAGPERDDEKQAEPEFQNPKPWETVVRIRVLAQGSVGFGSGTVIHSSEKETLILTCAHIFKLDGPRQAAPQRFPRKIMVDLFDGKLHGERPAQVHLVESVEGQAIDYDFNVDVGLIQIRPGRRLPAARVVPAHWEARSRMKMFTVGCSEGQDATAWATVIINPQMRGLSGNPSYQAIECMTAPKQGRSGGGLFTTDGHVAGVCNFAEPRGDHGLYATPRSIYSLLDRNNLMALYAPVRGGSGALLASRDRSRARGDSPITIARGQSPDAHEPDRVAVHPGDVTVPEPELLGIKPPLATRPTFASGGGQGTTRRMAWQPTHAGPAPLAKLSTPEPAGKTEQTDLNIDSVADHDRFSHFESDQPAADKNINAEDIPSAAGTVAEPSAKSRWRPARSGAGSASSEIADH